MLNTNVRLRHQYQTLPMACFAVLKTTCVTLIYSCFSFWASQSVYTLWAMAYSHPLHESWVFLYGITFDPACFIFDLNVCKHPDYQGGRKNREYDSEKLRPPLFIFQRSLPAVWRHNHLSYLGALQFSDEAATACEQWCILLESKLWDDGCGISG